MMGSSSVGGALVNWTEVADSAVEEFNEWYVRDHIPQRLALDGFVGARRYRAARSPRERARFLTVYEVTGVEALTSADYRSVLDHPTPWSRRVLPTILGGSRTACRAGHLRRFGTGVHCMAIAVPEGSAVEAPAAEALRDLEAARGVCGVLLLVGDPDATRAKEGSTESAIGTPRGPSLAWTLLVDGTDPGLVEAAVGRSLELGDQVDVDVLTLVYAAASTTADQ